MSQSSLTFVTVDVFTTTRYVGNPLAIIHVPAGTELSQEQKQLIAREFNLSETVFLHLPGPGSLTSGNLRKIDIFTPTDELPFAGHPTIGTACHVLSQVSESGVGAEGLVHGEFLTKAGIISLQYDTVKGIARAGIPHNVRIHSAPYLLDRLLTIQPGLSPSSFAGENVKEFPVVSIVNGMTFVLAQMKDLEALKPLVPLLGRDPVQLDDGWNTPVAWIYTYVRLPNSADGTRNIRSRMMMEGGEDPATGSASCALASYLALQEGKPGESLKVLITQGVEMGRKSDIGVEVKLGSEGKVEAVYLSGSAVQVMEGKLSY